MLALRGLKILQAFEKRIRADKLILDKGELEVLAQLDIDIRQHDEGKAAEAELRSNGRRHHRHEFEENDNIAGIFPQLFSRGGVNFPGLPTA